MTTQRVGLFARLVGAFAAPAETRSTNVLDIARFMQMGPETSSGAVITPTTAMQIATVAACVRVISETVAQLPLILYRRADDGTKDRAEGHPLWPILHQQPNEWQSAFEFIELLTGWCALRGNGYAFVSRVGRDRTVRELLPIHPDCMRVEQLDDMRLRYWLTRERGVEVEIPAADIFHLRGPSVDGFTGMSMPAWHRETFGLASAAAKFGGHLFANGARPSGVLEHPGHLKDEAREHLRKSVEAMTSRENAHRIAVLEDGMKFSPVSMTADDAQFLETRKFQRGEIASIFRVPLHKIGDLERATHSNIEQQSLDFLSDTLLPWLRRWEGSISRTLLAPQERGRVYAEFLVDGLLRADIRSRYEAYRVGIESGILSPNEARKRENLNPREGGDEYIRPLNMAVSGGDEGDVDPAAGTGEA